MKTRLLLFAGLLAYAGFCAAMAVAIPRPECLSCPPPDDAIGLVPADALAYAHADLGEDSEQLRTALALAAELPRASDELASRASSLLPGPEGRPVDFGADVAPWFGGELAVAILPATAGPPEQVGLIEIGDPAGAAAFVREISAGGGRSVELEGVTIEVDRRDLATARLGDFLAVGTEAGLRQIAETAAGPAEGSLASDMTVDGLSAALPPQRLADAYLSEDGIAELVEPPRSQLAALAPLISPQSSSGFGISLSAADSGIGISTRSSIDPEREQATPGFFSAFPAFSPSIDDRLPADTLAYVGVGDPGATATALVEQAGTSAPDIASGFEALSRELDDAGVQLERDVLGSLGGEAALSLTPAPRADGGGESEDAEPEAEAGSVAAEPGVAEADAQATPESAVLEVPVLGFFAEQVDAERARQGLAELQAPVARALGGGLGTASFEQVEVEGVEASAIAISPTLELAYALGADTLAAASSTEGLGALIAGEGGLTGSDRYLAATDGLGEEPALLVYLDLAGLVELGERFGLGADPVYARLAPEVRRLDALGVSVAGDDRTLSGELRLLLTPGE